MIEQYLSQRLLVDSVLTTEDLTRRIASGGRINMMMGQTFDGGQPVDMIKYALFMMNLSDIVQKTGLEVNSRWLIADHFITEINQDEEATVAKKQVQERVKYLERLNRIYRGGIGNVLSSELSRTDEYRKFLEILFIEGESNERFREELLKAVPEDRRTHPKAYRYPFEELATIQSLDTDIKIGPPYERHYDEPGREIAPIVSFKHYVGIYLTKSYPFGNPEIPASITKEIEAFGVLPYKKGSKGLSGYRIDPINDSLPKVSELIHQTKDPRAIVDLIVISDQARQRLEGLQSLSFIPFDHTDFVCLPIKELKTLALQSYIRHIHEPLCQ